MYHFSFILDMLKNEIVLVCITTGIATYYAVEAHQLLVNSLSFHT
jgi:hypothetical protein